jgi:hypothetical protein
MVCRAVWVGFLLASLVPAQDSRPSTQPASRPSSIFVLGTTEKGDRIWRFDAATLALSGTYEIDGSPSYCGLTPDGEELIVTTTRHGAHDFAAVFFGLDPDTFAERWILRGGLPLTWRGAPWYPVVTDPTVPDTVGFFHVEPIPSTDTRVSRVVKSLSLVRRGGVITRVPLPEETTWSALWRRDDRTWIYALTPWNHLWEVDAATGRSRRITTAPITTSAWTHAANGEGTILQNLVLQPPEGRAICFGKTGGCFAIDLRSGASARTDLLGLDAPRGVAFARRSAQTGRLVVCPTSDVCEGCVLAVISADLKNLISSEIRQTPFLDVAFSADGSRFATLTSEGLVRIHEGPSGFSLKRSDTPLPLAKGMHGASIAGWR